MANPGIVLLQDNETPAPHLEQTLISLGYSVRVCQGAFLDAHTQVLHWHPDLALVVVSLPVSVSAVETGLSLQANQIPVVFLAGEEGRKLLERSGVTDSFQILRWPVDESGLRAHLDMALRMNQMVSRLSEYDERMRSVTRYRSLFENSPISLWEEDFSAVKICVDDLKRQGITDLRTYFHQHPETLARIRTQLRVLDVNQATLNLYHAKCKEDLLAHLDIIFDDQVLDLMLEEILAVGEGRQSFEGEGINRDLDGNILQIHISWSVPPGSEDNLSNVIVSITDITAQKQRENVLKVIATVSSALRVAQNRAQMLPTILAQVTERVNATSSALVLYDAATGRTAVELALGEWAKATGRRINHRKNVSDAIIQSGAAYVNPDVLTDSMFAIPELVKADRSVVAMPLMSQDKSIGVIWVGRSTPFTPNEVDLLRTIAEIVANAIHRATLHEQTVRNAEQVAVVAEMGRALATTLQPHEIYQRLAKGITQLMPDLAGIYISNYDAEQRLITFAFGMQDGEQVETSKIAPVGLDSPWIGSQGEVIRTHMPLIVNDLQTRRQQVQTGVLAGSSALNTSSGIYVPMLSQNEILGVLYVQSYQANRFTKADGELLTLAANTGAIALQNARLFAGTQRRLQRLTALHTIDVAVSSSLDLRIILNILLDQLLALLHQDAADIIMIDPATQSLEYAAGRGFRSTEISRMRMKIGEGLAGQAVLQNRVFMLPDLARIEVNDPRYGWMINENIVAYSAAPLMAKGQVKGVLEIFHRTPPDLDAEWQEFLETLTGQVAVAIDNATLVTQLQRTNLELTLAYDRTLEGWSHALNIRDKDTEDHTRRVTELSVRLARRMGLSDAEIVQIRRGALLHDIGKLGIPDGILLKTGPLDEGEREVIQRHPIYAYEMLKSIDFLAPAREIPFCHHERWDGTGYPRGLKGEQIPLSARIFSVIDVWDSLCHDRPYRKAWPLEKARDYILAHSGKHFDPHVVEVFLKMI